MRTRDVNRKLFHKGHYEIIAARFREALEPWLPDPDRIGFRQRDALNNLALNFAKRLQLDNDEFDPIIFLDRCSPDPETYPLSELWEGVNQVTETEG